MDGFSIKVKVDIDASMELRGKNRHRLFLAKRMVPNRYPPVSHMGDLFAFEGFIISLFF